MDQNISNRIESKYERLRKIGIGSYGVVFKCVNRLSGQIVAIKRYSENDSDPIIRKIAMREVRMLRQLKHPNLIYLIEVFRRKRRLHLVFDYCELTVLDVIEKYGNSCPLNLIRKIVWQIVNGIGYCHSNNCIHRDIKPENILINQSGVVKLCDFGFARTLNKCNGSSLTFRNGRSLTTLTRDGQELEMEGNKENILAVKQYQPPNHQVLANAERQALTEYVATRWYRAPELLIGEVYYDIKIDIWAIGCVTAELMRGEPIWPGKTDLDQLFIIKNSLGQLTESQTHTLLTQAIYDQGSIERLLERASSSDNSLESKLPSRVGDSGLEFVSACLQMDPNKRPSSEELLKHSYIHSSKMNQFMKEVSGSSSGTYLSGDRGFVQGNEQEQNIRGQLVVRPTPRSNSQSLAMMASKESSITQQRASFIQPSNKRLVIANEQRPQQMTIPERIDSFESKYKRKQPAFKGAAPPKARDLPKIELKSLVPIASDRVRAVSDVSSLNKTFDLAEPNPHNRLIGKVSQKVNREVSTNRDKAHKNTDTVYQNTDSPSVKKDADSKGVAHKNRKSNQPRNYDDKKDISIGHKLKADRFSSGNSKCSYGATLNVESSASSTLSDTTSFLPSLFKADDPRKAKYTSLRKAH